MILPARLEKIESSGLIRLAQTEPELEYIFRHALVQDAAYESLLKADRRALHAAVGETLESFYPDRLDEIAATLALHFERAEEYQKTVQYLIRAGQAAARVYAVNEAIEFFHHALELLPASYPQDDLIHFYRQYGHVLELAGRFDAAIELYDQMNIEAMRRKNPQMELFALLSRGIIHATPSPLQDTDLAKELSKRALTLAIRLKDREAENRAYWILMLAFLFDDQIEAAITYGEKALQIAYQLNNPERLAFTLNDLAHCYSAAGQRQKASAINLEARLLWEKLGNTHMLVDNLNTGAQNLFMEGKLEEALHLATQTYEIARSIQNTWGQSFSLMVTALICLNLAYIDRAVDAGETFFAMDLSQSYALSQAGLRSILANLYLQLGHTQKASKVIRETYQIPPVLKSAFHPPVLASLARIELRSGNLPEAESLLNQALNLYNPGNFLTMSPFYVASAQYEIYTAQGEHLKALESLDAYIEVLYSKEVFSLLPEHFLYKAQALIHLNRQEEALALLKEIASTWAHLNFHHPMWKVYALMGELQHQFGHQAEARESHQKARENFDFLLNHTPSDLRESVLALWDVKFLLEDH